MKGRPVRTEKPGRSRPAGTGNSSTHDGFSGTAEGLHRLLDAGVWGDGIMAAYIALLRAVNVGGTGKLPMSDLRELCEKAGFRKVRTYIASGNVVFESRMTEAQV